VAVSFTSHFFCLTIAEATELEKGSGSKEELEKETTLQGSRETCGDLQIFGKVPGLKTHLHLTFHSFF